MKKQFEIMGFTELRNVVDLRSGASRLDPRTSGSGIPIRRACLAAETSIAFVLRATSFSDLLPQNKNRNCQY